MQVFVLPTGKEDSKSSGVEIPLEMPGKTRSTAETIFYAFSKNRRVTEDIWKEAVEQFCF